jgi:hypothetical protein
MRRASWSIEKRRAAISASASAESRGFTRLELALVIVALVIIFLLLLPSILNHMPRPWPKPPAGTQCLNNLRALSIEWFMYAEDNKGALVGNAPYVSLATVPTNNWVAGVMDWSTSSQNTNTSLLLATGLGRNVRSAQAYHCPNDRSVSAAGPRVRSYSMNAFVGDTGSGPSLAGWKQHLKMTQLRSPASVFVFVEEHANSIDDGSFSNDPRSTNAWKDLPASNHSGSSGFAFADGRAEMHRWLDADTRVPMVTGGPKPSVTVMPNQKPVDLNWVLERTTRPDTEFRSEIK